MSSASTVFRKEHPEYYEKERIRDNEQVKKLYHNNPEYSEKVKQQALAIIYIYIYIYIYITLHIAMIITYRDTLLYAM